MADTAGVEVHLGAPILEVWSTAHEYRCELQAKQAFAFQKSRGGRTTPLVLAPSHSLPTVGSASETERSASCARDHTFTYEVEEDSSYRSKLVLDGATIMWPYLHDLSVWDSLLNVFTLHDCEGDVPYTVETVLKRVSILLPHSAAEYSSACPSRGVSTAEELQNLTKISDLSLRFEIVSRQKSEQNARKMNVIYCFFI